MKYDLESSPATVHWDSAHCCPCHDRSSRMWSKLPDCVRQSGQPYRRKAARPLGLELHKNVRREEIAHVLRDPIAVENAKAGDALEVQN